MPEDDKNKDAPKPKGDITEARTRAEVAEMRAKLAEEIAADALVKAKKGEEEAGASAEKWKMIREFVTGPNLKWLLAMVVIISLVAASMFSGKVFTVSQGGIVFGATQVVPATEEEVVEEEVIEEEPTEPPADVVETPAKPTVITHVVERIVEVPAPAPAPNHTATTPPVVVKPVPYASAPVVEPEPTPEPEPEPEPIETLPPPPEPEPLPE